MKKKFVIIEGCHFLVRKENKGRVFVVVGWEINGVPIIKAFPKSKIQEAYEA